MPPRRVSGYDQAEAEWIVLFEGECRDPVRGATRCRRIAAWIVPEHPGAHARHRVVWTNPGQKTVWLAIHYAGLPGAGT